MQKAGRILVGAGLCLAALTAHAELTTEERIRLETLEEQVKDLRNKEKKEEDKERDGKNGVPLRTFYKDGIQFKSDDGEFDLTIGGRVVENGRFFTSSHPNSSTFYNKETQMHMKGKVYKVFKYEFEGNFTGSGGSSAFLNNSFLEYAHNEHLALRIGQWKEPILLEEMVSTLWRDFPEKSIATRLAPSRDTGVGIMGKLFDKVLGYELGYFNGDGKNSTDGNDDKDWAGRLAVSPWVNDKGHPLKKLQVFGFASKGSKDSTTPSSFSTTDTAFTFLAFNGSVRQFDDFNRHGGGSVWAHGPWSFKGEFIGQRVDLEKNLSGFPGRLQNENTRFDAWYATVGYVLTGEDAQIYDRINPKRPFPKSGPGAWEILGRVSKFQAEREPFANLDKQYASAPLGTVTGTGSATEMTSWQVGLNWTPVSNAKTLLSYGENRYAGADHVGALGADIRKKEQFVMLSAQFDF